MDTGLLMCLHYRKLPIKNKPFTYQECLFLPTPITSHLVFTTSVRVCVCVYKCVYVKERAQAGTAQCDTSQRVKIN